MPAADPQHGLTTLSTIAGLRVWEELDPQSRRALHSTSRALHALTRPFLDAINIRLTRSASESRGLAYAPGLPPSLASQLRTLCVKRRPTTRAPPRGDAKDDATWAASLAALFNEGAMGAAASNYGRDVPWKRVHSIILQEFFLSQGVTPYIGLAVPSLTSLELRNLPLEPWAVTGLRTCGALRSLRLDGVTWRGSTGQQGVPLIECGLRHLGLLTSLTALSLHDMEVPNVGLLVRNLTGLTALELSCARLSSSEVVAPEPHPEVVAMLLHRLRWPRVLGPLACLSHLEALTVDPDDARVLPAPVILPDNVLGMAVLEPADLAPLLQGCPRLRELHLGARTPLAWGTAALLLDPTAAPASLLHVSAASVCTPTAEERMSAATSVLPRPHLRQLTLFRPYVAALEALPERAASVRLLLGPLLFHHGGTEMQQDEVDAVFRALARHDPSRQAPDSAASTMDMELQGNELHGAILAAGAVGGKPEEQLPSRMHAPGVRGGLPAVTAELAPRSLHLEVGVNAWAGGALANELFRATSLGGVDGLSPQDLADFVQGALLKRADLERDVLLHKLCQDHRDGTEPWAVGLLTGMALLGEAMPSQLRLRLFGRLNGSAALLLRAALARRPNSLALGCCAVRAGAWPELARLVPGVRRLTVEDNCHGILLPDLAMFIARVPSPVRLELPLDEEALARLQLQQREWGMDVEVVSSMTTPDDEDAQGV